jgi:RNA polymerase sigma-70 factor (ECF subfamily)
VKGDEPDVGDLGWRRLLSRAARVYHGRLRFGRPRTVSADPWAWLEPYPAPVTGAASRSLSISFVAALQLLPPEQRAALILSDVLEFPIAEVAEILDCDTAEAGTLLLSARSTLAAVLPCPAGTQAGPAVTAISEPADTGEEAVVARFVSAFERGDLAGITALLTRDAWLRMRPLPVAYRGRRAARHFLVAVAFPGGTPRYRLVATRANGQPAFGCYLRDPAAARAHACGLLLLSIDGGRITAIDRFTDNSLLPRFGLPRALPAD